MTVTWYMMNAKNNLTRLAAGIVYRSRSAFEPLPVFATISDRMAAKPGDPTETQEHFSCHQHGCCLTTQTPQLDSIGLWRFAFNDECGIGRRERPTLTTCGWPVYVTGVLYSTPGLRAQRRNAEATAHVTHIIHRNAIATLPRAGHDRKSRAGHSGKLQTPEAVKGMKSRE